MKFIKRKRSLFNITQRIVYSFSLNNNKTKLALPAFSHFNLHPSIHSFLSSEQIHTPTYIQYSFISSLQTSNIANYHLISPTGSGKTLSYLIPIFNSLKNQQQQAQTILTKAKRPRVLILVPSKQLILQVRSQAKLIAHHAKIKVDAINIGRSLTNQNKILQQGIDILVSTHKRVIDMLNKNNMYLSCIKWLIVDQTDTFNDSQSLGQIFDRIANPILRKSQLQAKQFQIQNYKQPPVVIKDIFPKTVFLSTTNPPSLNSYLQENVKKYTKIQDDQTHHNLQNIKHQFHHCNQIDKHQPLLKIIKAHKNQKAIIFCNTIKSLNQLQYYLNCCGTQVLNLHSKLTKQRRLRNYELFRDNNCRILLSTDLGSRGLDFKDLDLVINYDFPLQLSDYLHRVGRSGRAGKKGLAISLYHKKNLKMIDQLRGCSFKQELNVQNSAYSLKNRNLRVGQSKFRIN